MRNGRGLAGVHIEDVVAGKHFAGHPDAVVDVRTFANRIRAATDARIDEDFVIIARSDTTVVEDMIERCAAAVEAGADMIFLPYLRRRDTERVQQECGVPMMQIGSSRIDPSTGHEGRHLPGDTRSSPASARLVRPSNVFATDSLIRSTNPSSSDLNRVVGSPEATSMAEEYGVVDVRESS